MLPKLRLKINHPNGERIHLTWTKQESFLANQHLPIMENNVNIGPQIMQVIGEFVFYYDRERCSAVVYFGKTQSFFGSIGLEHTIMNLPYKFDHTGQYIGIVDETYIKKRSNTPQHDVCNLASHPIVAVPESDQTLARVINSVLDLEDDLNSGNAQPILQVDPINSETLDDASPHLPDLDIFEGVDLSLLPDLGTEEGFRSLSSSGLDNFDILSMHEPGPSTKRRRIKRNLDEPTFDETMNANDTKVINKRIRRDNSFRVGLHYLETLIIIPRDVTDVCQRRFRGKSYLSGLIKYYIIYFNNIAMLYAKISSMSRLFINIAKIVIEDNLETIDVIRNNELYFSETVAMRRNYLQRNQESFPMDSFDYVIVLTGFPIKDESINALAKTNSFADLYYMRKNSLWYHGVPITILRNGIRFPVAAHEIGRMLGMTVNSEETGSQNMIRCHGIMQRGSSKCDRCLQWSVSDIEQYSEFFKQNRNRCFLLNKPRSLERPGPRKLVTPGAQCRCFGYDSTKKFSSGKYRMYVYKNGCEKPLQCERYENGGTQNLDTLLPFDGTSCDAKNKKVCWNMRCVDLHL